MRPLMHHDDRVARGICGTSRLTPWPSPASLRSDSDSRPYPGVNRNLSDSRIRHTKSITLESSALRQRLHCAHIPQPYEIKEIMAINIQDLHNNVLPVRMATNATTAKSLGIKFQLFITGTGGGEWYVDCSDSGPNMMKGNPGGADSSITMSVEDFTRVYADWTLYDTLYFQGKVKISGKTILSAKLKAFYNL